MPYNLRKRKVAEPVQAEEVRKRKVTEPAKQETRKRKATTEPAAKPAARKRKTVEPVKDEEEPPKSIVVEPVKHEEEEEKETEQEQEQEAPPKRVADETVLKEEKAKKVKFEGNLFMFGVDGCGELGMGKIGITRKNPKPVPIDVPIKQIACGPCHTLALTESGKIYSFGCNDEGALGRVTDGDETLEATPTIIEMAGEVTKITTGDSHGAALTKENQVFIWGNFRDEHGSTGLLPECKGEKTFKPIQVMPEKKVPRYCLRRQSYASIRY
uniref:Regulator of chromosome condensation n=1 Tax=Aceria tosichella TaxID=561515 RepID=A0A6G1SDT2_9ACAR